MKLTNKAKTIIFCVGVILAVAIGSVAALIIPGDSEETTTSTPIYMVTTEATTATTQPPTTTAPTTEVTTLPTTAAPTTAATTEPTAPAEPTSEEILQKVADGVNALKAADASYIGTKKQNIVIDVTDCSYSLFLSVINGVVDLMANEETVVYDFTNGSGLDPEENVTATAMSIIPPENEPFALTIAGVASASYEKIGDNTKYVITLVPETGTYQQPKPTHHGVACDTLDFSRFEIPMGKITKSDFNYPGAIVTVTYNAAGQVVAYSEYIAMDGVGEGEAFGITASASMEGYIDEQWTIQWK